MDCVFLEGLTSQAHVGLLAWEKITTQAISIDCYCYLDSCQQAALEIDLSATVDYAAVRELILALIQKAHYDLLETLGETVTQALFDLSATIKRVVITVKKTTIFPDATAAGVRLDRSR